MKTMMNFTFLSVAQGMWIDAVIPILICVVLPIAIVWIVSHYRRLDTDRKAEVMIKAIESGTPVDPAFFKPQKKDRTVKQDLLDRLNGACVTSLMGAAFLMLSIFGIDFMGFGRFLPVAGAVMLAIGIALFIVYFVGKKMFAKEIDAEEKKLDEQQ